MKLYFAGSGISFLNTIEEKGGRVLISYYDFQNRQILPLGKKVFLDSGAFSAFTQGVKINLDKYIEFIKDNQDRIETYANLDVINDYKKTQENQLYMESKGLHPLPVYHYGEPIDVLKKMIEKYDYIGIGGLVPFSTQRNKLRSFLDKCFKYIRLECRVHGFGLNSVWALKRYPFYSVDATSWIAVSRYGQFLRFNQGKEKIIKKKEKDIVAMKIFQKDKLLLEKQIEEYIKIQRFITKLWETRGVKWEE